MPWDTFAPRALLALAFLLIASLVELALRGHRAVRWRYSLFLIACGGGGAALGCGLDAVTSAVSPAYFAMGKGLGEGDGLSGRALLLGAAAGTSAGVVLGCGLLAMLGGRALAWRPALTIGGAAVAGSAAGMGVGWLVPLGTLGDWQDALAWTEQRPFLAVWCAHCGVYVGALAGAVRAVVNAPPADDAHRRA